MSQQPFYREPVFWTTSNAEQIGFNSLDREKRIMRDGREVRVKHPQAGHQGDYDALVRMRGEGYRFMTIVKTNGATVFYTLTNGAADMDPNSGYAIERKQKARFYGWYRIGACPVALLRAGEMHPGHFVDQSLLEAAPCEHGTYGHSKPCPHALAEKAARQKRHAAYEAETAASYANKAEEAQRAQTAAIVAAQQQQTEALVGVITSALNPRAKAVKLEADAPADDGKGKR
jgi:hypothetical protein